MNDKLALLAERRRALIQQAATQRALIALQIDPLKQPLAMADRGLEIIGYLKQYPLLIAGTTTLLSLMRPFRYGKWLNVGWLAFKLARDVKRKWIA